MLDRQKSEACWIDRTASRVLVVDDESLVRWSLAETLGASGYEVTEARDGASAIRAFDSLRGGTDVVLLDLRLPDSGDLRILAAMRQLAPTVPVIVMTAFGTPELLNEAKRLGAFAVIDKPFDMSHISPLIERALAAPAH
jgi:two-component system, NtrC family, response regulator AtoC